MEQKFSDDISKRIVAILLLITIIVLISCKIIGDRQNDVFLADGLKLAEAQNAIASENYQQAEVNYAELVDKYPHSSQLLWDYGTCLAFLNDYPTAVTYYRKALEAGKDLAREPIFLIEMGDALGVIKEYEEAASYLQVARMMALSEVERELVENLLSNIAIELGGD